MFQDGCLQDVWWVSSRFLVVVFKILGLSPGPPIRLTAPPLDRLSAGPPKISLFFSVSRRKFHSFFSLWGVFSLNFGGVFEGRGPEMCMFGLSGCRVKPRRLRGRRFFTQQLENSKRAHLSALALQTPPKFHEKTPREGRKERILRRETEKKREMLGSPHPSGHPSGPCPFGAHPKCPLLPPPLLPSQNDNHNLKL